MSTKSRDAVAIAVYSGSPLFEFTGICDSWERAIGYQRRSCDRKFEKLLYLFKTVVAGRTLHKVGVTRNIKERFSNFKNLFPLMEQCEIVKQDHIIGIEELAETAFILQNRQFNIGPVGGEWFDFTNADHIASPSLPIGD